MKAKFGRYVFLKKIAAGGMAEIFLARRLSFGGFSKFVVIKRLLPQHIGKRAYERLFLAEARTGALLNHPNIVSLYDVGKLDNAFFMAMEYIEGVSVAEMMARAASQLVPVPVGVAIRIACGVAQALQYAHHALDLDGEPLQIIHHDISPQNIQVSFEGDVKLLDFGVATRMGRSAAGGRRGKFGYMSPEAIRAEPLDQRSDLYSLGVVLYELTCGRRLFKGADAEDEALRKNIPRPTRVDPYYPSSLEEVVLKALSPTPGERHGDMHALLHDLPAVARRLGCDVGPEALARHLDEAFGAEIGERRAQQAELARASLPRSKRAPPAEVGGAPAGSTEMAAAAPSDPAPPAEDPSASVEQEEAEQRLGDWAEVPLTPSPPPETAVPEAIAGEPSGEFDAQDDPDDPSGEFIVPQDVLSPEADWEAARAAPVIALRRATGILAVLGVALAIGALFAGRSGTDPPAQARLSPDVGVLVVESDPTGARVYDGDSLMGMTPFEAPPAPVGTLFALRLTKAGHAPWESRVALLPDRRHRTVLVALRPEIEAPAEPRLRVQSIDPHAPDAGADSAPPPAPRVRGVGKSAGTTADAGANASAQDAGPPDAAVARRPAPPPTEALKDPF